MCLHLLETNYSPGSGYTNLAKEHKLRLGNAQPFIQDHSQQVEETRLQVFLIPVPVTVSLDFTEAHCRMCLRCSSGPKGFGNLIFLTR